MMLRSNTFQRPSRRGGERGQALVEFALTVLVFLMLLVMIIEVGRILWTYVTLQHAAKTGARYAVTGRWLEEYAEDTTAHFDSTSDDPLSHIPPCHPLFPDDPAAPPGEPFIPSGAWEYYEPYRNPRTCSVERLTLQQMSLLPLDVNAESDEPGFYEVVVSGYTTDMYPTTGTFTRACAACPGGEEELAYSDYFAEMVHGGDDPGLSRGFGGKPQQKVVVQIRYRLPIITPILDAIVPSIRLDGTATMVNEAWGSTGNNREAILPPPFVDDLGALEDVQPANLVVTQVSIVEPPTPHEIGAGEPAEFEVVINNIGNQDAVDPFEVALYAHRNPGLTTTPLTDGGFIALGTPQSVSGLGRDVSDTLTFTVANVDSLIAAGGGEFYIYAWVDSGDAVDEVGTGELTFPENEEDNANVTADPLVVETAFELTVTTEFSNHYPAPSDPVTYRVTITNTGSAASPNLWLNDFVPDGLSPTGGDSNYNASEDRGEPGAIAPGDAVIIELPVEVTGSIGDMIIAWTGEMLDADASTPVSYTAVPDTLYVGGTDIGLSVDVTLLSATQIQIVIEAANNGPNDATGVVVGHTFSEPGALSGGTATGDGTYDIGTHTWTVDVANGDTASVTLIDDLIYGGFLFESIATLNTGAMVQHDYNSGNNTASDSEYVPGAELTVTLTQITTPAVVDAPFEFQVTVSNSSDGDLASGIVVEITLPSEVTPSDPITWTVPVDVGPGDSVSETYTVQMPATFPPGSDPLEFTATITGFNEELLTKDWPSENLTDTLSVSPSEPTIDLTVNKSVDSGNPTPTQAYVGDTVTYTIAVQNTSAETTVEGVTLVDNLPATYLTDVAVVSISAGSYAAGTWTIGDLAPGGTATLELSAVVAGDVPGGTVITNTITDDDVDATNAILQIAPGSTPSASLTVGTIELAVDLSTDANVYAVDEDLVEFTITVENIGSGTASDIHVAMTGGGDFGLPTELSWEDVVSYTHGSLEGGTEEWVIDTLPAGETATLVFTANVDSVPGGDFSGTITAQARAVAGEVEEEDDTDFKVYEPLWVNLGTTNSSCPALSWGGSTASELSGLPYRLSGSAPTWRQNQAYNASDGWGYFYGGSRRSDSQEFHYPDDSQPVDSTTQTFFNCRTEDQFYFGLGDLIAGQYRVYLAFADYEHQAWFFGRPGRVFDVEYRIGFGGSNLMLDEYNIAAEAGGQYRVHVETVTFTLGAAADYILLYFNNGETWGSWDRSPLVQGVGFELLN